MKIIRNISDIELSKIENLYDEAFNDPINYRKLLLSTYLNKAKFFGVVENNELIMMTFFVPKRILFLEQKMTAYLIFAVAVKKEYQGKGIMKTYLNKFIEEMKFFADMIFIQAYNFDVYKSFDFLEITNLSQWFLRKDQYLKTDNLLDKIDYDLINKINIEFINIHNFENFAYKTEKENKKYLKLYHECGGKILMSNKSYIIYDEENKKVVEYAFLDLKDFIKVLSNLPFQTPICSYIDLDKRYFTQLKEKYVFTKALKNKIFSGNEKIFFLDNW